MDYSAYISFLLYAIVNAITPGPGNLLAMNTTIRFGWKKGARLLWGIFAGYYVVQIICACFVYGLSHYFAAIIGFMKYVGAAYILWLAISIAKSRPDPAGEEKRPSFWTGFALQLVNAKIYLFGITALTGYIVPFYSTLGALLKFEVYIATIGTMASILWAFVGNIIQKTYQTHFRIINIILAIVLLECAISLLFV